MEGEMRWFEKQYLIRLLARVIRGRIVSVAAKRFNTFRGNYGRGGREEDFGYHLFIKPTVMSCVDALPHESMASYISGYSLFCSL